MKITTTIILILSLAFTSIAQDIKYLGAPYINNYVKTDYNASAQNWDIIQDSRGVMFIANTSALLEFDGKDWKGYSIGANAVVRTLDVDSLGRIWVGGYNEFGYVTPDSIGSFKYTSISAQLPDSIKEIGDVAKLFATKNGIYLLAPRQIHLWKNNKLTTLDIDLVPGFAARISNKIYILDKKQGIGILNDLSVTFLENIKGSHFGSRYANICEYKKDKIAILTTDAGFFIYDTKTKILEKHKTNPLILDYLKKNIGAYAFAKGKNRYAIGTFNGGILVLDEKLELTDVINDERGLESNCVYTLEFDENDNLWAGTQNGVSYISINTPIRKYGKKQNVNASVMDAVFFNNREYIATLQGCYYLNTHELNPQKDNHVFHIINNIDNSWDMKVIDNKLFTSGRGGIYQIIDTTANVLLDMKNQTILCFAKSSKFPNTIFFSNSGGKVHYLETKENPKSKFLKANKYKTFDGLNYKIQDIKADKEGNLWLSTLYSKIIYIKFTGDSIENYEVSIFDEKNNLPSGNILKVHFFNDKLNITTPKGIYKPIYTNGKNLDSLTQFEHDKSWGEHFTKDSAYCSNIYKIKENKYLIEGYPPAFLTKLKDSVNIETEIFSIIERGSHIQYENNYVKILSTSSFSVFDISRINKQQKFKTLIREVLIANDSLIFLGNFYKKNGNELLLSEKQNKYQVPVIQFVDNSLVFFFMATFYEEAQKTEYSYYIENFSKEWSNWDIENKATFTNIPEGKYTFKVKAKNIYGVESDVAEYKFKILPPWYRTILAYILYVIFAVIFIWIIVKLNSKRLLADKKRLEDIVTERTAEIFQQKEEIQTQADNLQEQAEKMAVINQELEKLSIVASETDNSVLIFNENLDLEWVNEAYSKIYGYTLNEIFETGNFNLLERSENAEIKKLVDIAIKEKQSVTYESENKVKDGSIKWVQTTLTPIFEQEKLHKLIAIESDFTEIHEAKEIILSKNEQIESSINYAQTIQQASLPTEVKMRKYLDYFLLFKPKDIVSGDFYWFTELSDNEYILAEVDCTGHGVPGAFMSLIGNTLLNEIVNYKKITSPAKILKELDILVKKALNQEQSDNLDGMDLTLCKYTKIDEESTKIVFSGAKQDLLCYIKDEKNIKILKGDRKNIGGFLRKRSNETDFTNQEITLKKGDMMYLMSDGYADQNNAKRRKFGTGTLIAKLTEIAEEPLPIQKNTLLVELKNWQGNELQRDDITILGIKI